MDYKKINAPLSTITRDMNAMCADTGNVYETVCIIARRANQISVEMKQELEKKLQEFASYNDNLEEVFENREQIEISRYYEKLPKPTLIATQEYLEHKIYYKFEGNAPLGIRNDLKQCADIVEILDARMLQLNEAIQEYKIEQDNQAD